MSNLVVSNVWPVMPYKGLSFYGPEDVPLFAGREDDIKQCANVLANRSTRIVILHGATGCGKSSFLRAGLLPFLEKGTAGFQFLKEDKNKKYKALFVRSTDCPLVKLSEAVYDFASNDVEVGTFMGPETLRLSKVLFGYDTKTSFIEKVGTNAEQIIEVLGEVTSELPKTLVLVIDQGEEVLTLNPSEEGDLFRQQFFEFISLFSKRKIDLKLLVALRTEYYGRFIDQCRSELTDITNIRDYFLSDLTKEQLVRAIERPTYRQEIPEYGKPYNQYRFSYAPGLATKIAHDLKLTALAGGTLPVMQIVCDSLYRITKQKKLSSTSWVITSDDYQSLGGVEGQMEEHLRRVLEQLCKNNDVPDREIPREIDCWKEVLSKLVKSQVDGTVTTELIKSSDLATAAKQSLCRIEFEKAMNYLSDDDVRILRPVEVIALGTGIRIQCYSLGHDAIGLILRKWKVAIEENKGKAQSLRLRFYLAFGIFSVLLAPIWYFLFPKLIKDPDSSPETPVTLFKGILTSTLILTGLAGLFLIFSRNDFIKDTFNRLFSSIVTSYLLLAPPSIRQRLWKSDLIRAAVQQYPDLRKRIERSLLK